MPELEVLRGVAVLGVLLLHGFSWQYSPLSFGKWGGAMIRLTQPGWIGVNLFFVLSGFLITGVLLDSKSRPDFYRRFYVRRALRILPAYYTLLLLLLLLRSSSPAFVGLSFIYLANVTSFFGVACGYGPLWSLAVEEHFYIFWPAVVRNFTAKHLAWVSAAVVVLSPAMRAISFSLGWKEGLDWYTWFVADGLAAGALLAIVLRSGISRLTVKRLCALLFVASVIAAIAGGPFGITSRNRPLGAGLQFTCINAFFAAVLLIFLMAGSGTGKRYVNLPAVRFLGYISYGLYLNHLLVFRMYDRVCGSHWPSLLPRDGHFELVLLRFAVAGSAAIAIAYLSRAFFEERFLRMKDSLLPELSPVNKVATEASTQAA